MDENDSIQPTPDSGYLQSDSQNGDTGFSQDNDMAVSHDRLIDTAQDNESRQADDSVKSEPDTKSGADDSVKLTADDTDGDTVRKDDTNMDYVTETRDASATDEVSASLEENSKSKKKSKTKKKKKRRKRDETGEPESNLNEEEFELATVKTNHALGTREDDPIIAPIDLDRRKEEEQRIKMSWTQQLSVSNKVSPADIPDTELSTMDYHPEKAVDISKFGSTVPINGASTYSPVQDQRKMEMVIGGDDTSQSGDIGCCGSILMFLSFILVLVTFPISLFFCIKVVQEYERAVIFRVGRLLSGGSKGPGIFFVLPCIEGYTKVDLRTVSFDVPPQEILTSDSVTVSVDAVVYYRVCNPTISVANVENAHHATRLLAQTTLRNILGTKSMSEILTDRESISKAMQSMLDEATIHWGIKVERVEIKDVRLPKQLQRAMAAEAEASREARAKVLAAEGEHNASKALKEAADIIHTSPAALQLRYLQTLNQIASEKNSTIVFPLPVDFLSSFMK